jgi:thiosulfate dehydrogenase
MHRTSIVRPARTALLLVMLLGGCRIEDDASFRRASASRVAATSPGGALAGENDPGADTLVPAGPSGDAIRRGRAILLATRDSLPANVGNGLRCVSCHLDEGRRPHAMPWTGVYARFPQYRSRRDRVERLEDRINDCFMRSLAGRALPAESPAMRDIVAYMAHLSRGVPVGAGVAGQGVDTVRVTERGDPARGKAVFTSQCARCHGPNGEGTKLATPLWGPRSFTIGAGMARWRVTASFVRHNMPNDRPESLSDAEAVDVAAFITSQRRPDFPGKEFDWPRGNAPPDAAYKTLAPKPRRSAGGA